ncbi:MAG: dipeptidase [Parachlamydiales bacterium]|nr:dipeptidase [Parachlamydiales bacterium]
MISIDELKQYFQENSAQIQEEYFTFLKFASISTDPAYKDDMKKCFKWLQKLIEDMGFTVEEWPTNGHPVLFAENMSAGPDKPTVMIYQHYDVQPVDPLELWDTPPFDPQIRDGEVFARGAQDNKGQCFYSLMALRALISKGALPVNIKLCIEGEEEIGSGGLIEMADSKKDKLKSDHLIVADLGLQGKGIPTVTLGLRGVLTMTAVITEGTTDAHSGEHGGILYNPIRAMVELLSKLHDEKGRVAVPHFYDDVQPLSDEDKKILHLDFDEDDYQKKFGAKALGGEEGFSPLERAWIRPTLEINGISGGYAGNGFKTVIPSKATAKISCRIVANQHPEKIQNLVVDFLKRNVKKGLKLNIELSETGGFPMRTSATAPIVTAMRQSYEEVFKKPCRAILAGGSINVVYTLAQYCNQSTVMMGMGLDDDNIHAPNEHFGWDRFQTGFLIIARVLQIIA